MRSNVIEGGGQSSGHDGARAALADGAAGSGGEHGEIDDVPADNRAVVDGNRKPLLNGANVATQQLHGFGLSPKSLHKPVLGPSAACFPLCGRNQHFKEPEAFTRSDAAGRARLHHRRVARSKPNLASLMRNIEFWRLRDDDFQAIVTIRKQIVVAKEEPRAQRRSDCAKFGKDRLYRSAKRRAWATARNQRSGSTERTAPAIRELDHVAQPYTSGCIHGNHL